MFARKSLIYISLRFIISFLNILFFYFAVRNYLSSEFGYFRVAVSLFAFFSFFTNLNLSTAHVKYIPEEKYQLNQYFSAFGFLKITLLIFCSVIFYFIIAVQLEIGIIEANSERLHDMVLDGKGSIEEAYNRRTWIILSMLVMVLCVLFSMVRPGFREAVGAIGSDIMLFNALMLPLAGLQMYTISMIVAKEVTTIRSLGKLFSHTSINLRPLDPDMCGGLHRLRDFAIIVTYLIAWAGLGLCLLAYLSFQAGHLATDYVLHILLASYLIVAPYCFFATLGTAHQAMKVAKESFLSNISEQFQSIYSETQKQLTLKHGELRESLGKIEQLQTFYKLTQAFPVWPFDVGSIRRFVVTTAAPVLSTVVAAGIARLL